MSESIKLPEGKTCSDCVHFDRCKGLFMCSPANVECDWLPVKFHEAKP